MEEVEYCDPFDGKKYGYYMKLEHSGRYVFARDFIEKNFPDCVSCDIACATGYGVQFLASVCKHIDGFDNKKEYLVKAMRRKIKNASFYQIDFNAKVLTNKQYDVAVCFETIEHIENTTNFLKSLQNVIKKGGYLLISIPNEKFEEVDEYGKIIYKYHKHIFSKKEAISLLKKYGFEVEDIYGQSLCNLIVSNQHYLKHNTNKFNKKFLSKHNYSKDAIIMNSYIFAYPNKMLIDETYSYIFVCKKV